MISHHTTLGTVYVRTINPTVRVQILAVVSRAALTKVRGTGRGLKCYSAAL